MRVLLFVILLASGCGERRANLKATALGATAFALGAVMIDGMEEEVPPGYGEAAVALVVVGGLTTALAGLDAIFLFNARPAPVDCEPQVRAATREHAWTITKAAALAARRDDCQTVVEADARVAALDAEFHAVVFRRDAAIARCLAQGRL